MTTPTNALQRHIGNALHAHTRAHERTMYCTCGAWASDMDAHRTEAVMSLVRPELDRRDTAVATAEAEREQIRELLGPEKERADKAIERETALEGQVEQLTAERDGAYRERAQLLAHFAALYPSHIGPTDPNTPDWPVLIVETPAGQMSWHQAERDLNLLGRVPATEPEHRGWDGHSTEEKYERLRALTSAVVEEGVGCLDPVECGHEAALGQARAELERVRAVRDAWRLMTLEPGQVRRLLDEVGRALDGEEQPRV